MTQEQVHELVRAFAKGQGATPSLIETHASWVLLSREFAFKIKKHSSNPVLNRKRLASNHKIKYRENLFRVKHYHY